MFPVDTKPVAIISVYDKTGIIDFAREISNSFTIICSGGTAKVLSEANIPIESVEKLTGFPEILDGRVKTLHPNIHAGILARNIESHQSQLRELKIESIQMVVCNLYPFYEVISSEHKIDDAIENIDIGGSTLIRSAAKNYHNVIVIVDPQDYDTVLGKFPDVDESYRLKLAQKAFAVSASYDTHISNYFLKQTGSFFGPRYNLSAHHPIPLRYGENWHQKAAYYLYEGKEPFYEQLHGREVSFNNIVDLLAALSILSEHTKPTAALIKHTSPCGVASAEDIETAFDHAFETDKISAFGAAMGFNRPITSGLAEKLHNIFVDIMIATDYEPDAFEILAQKERIILLKLKSKMELPEVSIKLVPNGVLVQDADFRVVTEDDLKYVSKRKPTLDQIKDLLWAWKIVKYAKSNSAVITKGTRTLGVGMGQTSRIGAVKLACEQAGDKTKGSILASDAFFPFGDCVEYAANLGIEAILAPGGSIRDCESIDAANELDIALVWSKVRCFLH
jgi:phosphoribosylaminoimidazolecarboxamide formyltransferase/IMP cyclohydrolase